MGVELAEKNKLRESPELNGMIERYDRLIQNQVRKRIFNPDDWEDCIHDIYLKITYEYRKREAKGDTEISNSLNAAYINWIINSVIVDRIRKDTSQRTDYFLVKPKDILNWKALSNILQLDRPDTKWIVRFIKKANKLKDIMLKRTFESVEQG